MKSVRISLFVLIIIGVCLLLTQHLWVPKLVNKIVDGESISSPSLAQTSLAANQYVSTSSDQENFNISYPKEWSSRKYADVETWEFQSAPFSENLHGVGIPPMGNMWVSVAKGVCNSPSDDFTYVGPKPDLLYKTICQDGFQISLGLWQDDPLVEIHKHTLKQISESFHARDHSNGNELQTISFENIGVSITYPLSWFARPSANAVSFSNVEQPGELSETKLQNESFFHVLSRSNDNPLGLSLDQWFDQTMRPVISDALRIEDHRAIDGYIAIYTEISEVGGRNAHIYVLRGTDVTEITYGLFASKFVPVYEAMLKSIQLTSFR